MRGRLLRLTWQHDPTANAPAKYRRACRYEAFLPVPLQGQKLRLNVDTAGVVSEAEVAILELNKTRQMALAPLARLLLRTESVASSKVEGMQMGARELARAEARMESGAKVGDTAVEVLANIDAMQLAIENAASSGGVSAKDIEAIHRTLLERSPNPRLAGRVRTVQNWIGGNDHNPCGADFVPPPPEYVDGLLSDLCDAINDDLLPPLVQAALVHAQFETIHPFEDGNGRTGRALIHLILRRRGIAPVFIPPISVVLAAKRDRYVRGLVDFREDRTEEWIEQFAAAAATAARLASQYLQAIQDLAARWRDRLTRSEAAPRADAAAWAIIEALPGYPIITAPVAAAATGRSKPQIYQALSQLESAGVLEALSRSRRNRSWEAVGLLDLLAGLEAAEPI